MKELRSELWHKQGTVDRASLSLQQTFGALDRRRQLIHTTVVRFEMATLYRIDANSPADYRDTWSII